MLLIIFLSFILNANNDCDNYSVCSSDRIDIIKFLETKDKEKSVKNKDIRNSVKKTDNVEDKIRNFEIRDTQKVLSEEDDVKKLEKVIANKEEKKKESFENPFMFLISLLGFISLYYYLKPHKKIKRNK